MKITIDITDMVKVERIITASVNLVNFCYPDGLWAGFLPITGSSKFLKLMHELNKSLLREQDDK